MLWPVPICTNCNNFASKLSVTLQNIRMRMCEGQSIFESCHIKLKSFAMFDQRVKGGGNGRA